MIDAWSGNWYERIKERASERGFDTVTAFADSQPTASLIALAEQLGKEDVAAAQVEKILVVEAEATGTIERCARSLLVRRLHTWLPEGWHTTWDDAPMGSTFRRAAAYGAWVAGLGKRYQASYRRVGEALKAAALDAGAIPEGWLPSGPDDPILVELFWHWNALE